MGDKKNRDERVQELYNRLADSILELSDEAVIAEVSETDSDPQEEAELVRMAFKEECKQFDLAERRCTTEPGSIRKREASNGSCRYTGLPPCLPDTLSASLRIHCPRMPS